MKMERDKSGIPAWHGLGRRTFAAFDLAHVAPFNRNLFRSLGYDGLVYFNEIESPSDFQFE